MSETAATIIIAAGGTGGHLFPAEAMARELDDRGYRVLLITDERGRYRGGGFRYFIHQQRFRLMGGASIVQEP